VQRNQLRRKAHWLPILIPKQRRTFVNAASNRCPRSPGGFLDDRVRRRLALTFLLASFAARSCVSCARAFFGSCFYSRVEGPNLRRVLNGERKFRLRILKSRSCHAFSGGLAMAETRSTADLDRALKDMKNNVRGVAKDVKGAANDVYGQARDSATQVADSAAEAFSDTVSSFERALRRTIETQPYTTLLIGIGIGWLLGRSHRPF
jgi:ElaB/YqjD/DUF883 family membrane-anchored ribosome-binding protein